MTSVIKPVGSPPVLPNGATVPLSPAFRVHDTLYVSGQLAFGSDGRLIEGDITAQTLQCLQNIEKILSEEGVYRSAVVKTTAWLTNKEDFAAFNAAYATFFAGHNPARSTVRSDLLLPEARVEIEAIAYIKE